MKGVFKCARKDDERRSGSVKRSSLGIPPWTPKKYSRRLKHLILGMPPCIPFSINNHQFSLLHTIFLSLCAMLGASLSLVFSGLDVCYYYSNITVYLVLSFVPSLAFDCKKVQKLWHVVHKTESFASWQKFLKITRSSFWSYFFDSMLYTIGFPRSVLRFLF